MTVDQDKLAAELDALAAFSEVPAPAVTRVVFSPVDLKARAYVKGLCATAGLARSRSCSRSSQRSALLPGSFS